MDQIAEQGAATGTVRPRAIERTGRAVHARLISNLRRKTKTILVILVSLTFATTGRAGIVGWLTSEARPWQFIQQTGGIRVSAPLEKEGRTVLPVDYWPEGNSGLAVRRIELKKKGAQLVIRVVTQVVEKGSNPARVHFVNLAGVPAGSYEVYYETAGDPAKRLARIDIK
jgi:hypothetical protein